MDIKPPSDNNSNGSISDSLDNLPVDRTENDDSIDKSIKSFEGAIRTQKRQKMGLTAKEVGYATILLIFFMLPITDKLIEMAIPMSENSTIIKMLIKAGMFFILLYLIVHPWNK